MTDDNHNCMQSMTAASCIFINKIYILFSIETVLIIQLFFNFICLYCNVKGLFMSYNKQEHFATILMLCLF